MMAWWVPILSAVQSRSIHPIVKNKLLIFAHKFLEKDVEEKFELFSIFFTSHYRALSIGVDFSSSVFFKNMKVDEVSHDERADCWQFLLTDDLLGGFLWPPNRSECSRSTWGASLATRKVLAGFGLRECVHIRCMNSKSWSKKTCTPISTENMFLWNLIPHI